MGTNSVLAAVFCIFAISSPFTYYIFIYGLRHFLADNRFETRFNSLYGDLEDKKSAWLYYPLFFARRFFYVVVLVCLVDSPEWQVGCNIAHSVVFVAYLAIVRPHYGFWSKVVNMVLEIVLLLAFSMVGLYLTDVDGEALSMSIQVVVLGGVATCLVFAIFAAFYDLFAGKSAPVEAMPTLDNMVTPVTKIAKLEEHEPDSAFALNDETLVTEQKQVINN